MYSYVGQYYFQFENMQQAKSVLAQVVYALAVAEECLQFEHRDLHWGNILVKPTNREDITFKLMGRRCSVPSMGVEANIIDFTMSRLTKGIYGPHHAKMCLADRAAPAQAAHLCSLIRVFTFH